jgi:hypothetical protein
MNSVMSGRALLAGLLVYSVATSIASAQFPARLDTAGWKIYRNETMGFETSYPAAWHVRSAKRAGSETVSLSETPQAGKPQRAIQFWVQRRTNPRGLSIQKWYADQLRGMKAASPPTTNTSIGGRSAVRMESVDALGRQFQFFTSLRKTDVFEITVTQPSSQKQLDRTYETLLSTVRFIR